MIKSLVSNVWVFLIDLVSNSLYFLLCIRGFVFDPMIYFMPLMWLVEDF